ncbi:unnamed protein product [Acanthoscelides obtectus]|uniref:Uncharacterized protein n=1 Tax=Acanthoscelides obtectus TaxID=200917 RepID=A0A9P0JR65_ACAOB|nr:unnamed protein product [Acanthoscelides obtectus]CAK1667923.1 hypothetical protein AOBTE_LOCUS26120 [Acanthoscelides obtectus]
MRLRHRNLQNIISVSVQVYGTVDNVIERQVHSQGHIKK